MGEDGVGFASFIIEGGDAIGIETLPGALFDAHGAFGALVVEVGDNIHTCFALVAAAEGNRAVEVEMVGLVIINKLFDSFGPVISP